MGIKEISTNSDQEFYLKEDVDELISFIKSNVPCDCEVEADETGWNKLLCERCKLLEDYE